MNVAHLDGLATQHEKSLGSLSQEAGKLVHEDMLNLVGLLDADADSHAVDTRFDQHALALIAGNREWVQKELWRGGSLNLGHIMSLGRLRGKVRQREGSGQGRTHALQVRPQGLRLYCQFVAHASGGITLAMTTTSRDSHVWRSRSADEIRLRLHHVRFPPIVDVGFQQNLCT